MDFSLLNLKGLKSECQTRGLPVGGIMADLLLRLKADEDKKKTQTSGSPQLGRNASLPNRSRSAPQLASPVRSGLADLTEADLEQICRDSFVPKYLSDQISQRDADIQNQFNVKRDELLKRRDESIKRAGNKCAKDIEKLVKERDGKLDENQEDRDKQKNWYPAFNRLKDRRLARGARPPHPSDFDPSRRRPAPPLMAPSPPASPPLKSQADAFRKSRAPSPSAASTATMAATSTMRTPTPSSNKRRASQMDDNEDAFYRTAPSGPRAQLLFQSEHRNPSTPSVPRAQPETQPFANSISLTPKYRAQLSNTTYIFISARSLPVELRQIANMYNMLDKEPNFRTSRIRGDSEGYYWIFDAENANANRNAFDCHEYFQGRLFYGAPLQLELKLRTA